MDGRGDGVHIQQEEPIVKEGVGILGVFKTKPLPMHTTHGNHLTSINLMCNTCSSMHPIHLLIHTTQPSTCPNNPSLHQNAWPCSPPIHVVPPYMQSPHTPTPIWPTHLATCIHTLSSPFIYPVPAHLALSPSQSPDYTVHLSIYTPIKTLPPHRGMQHSITSLLLSWLSADPFDSQTALHLDTFTLVHLNPGQSFQTPNLA